MRSRTQLRYGAAFAALAMSAFVTTTATAADDAADGPAEVEEVVVTARLRAETLTEAPLSITAYTAQDLENQQIDHLRDLAALTPGLGFEQAASSTSSRPVIRGQSQLARSSGDVANVGIFVDGVYSPGLSGTEANFVGLERVEVVRGPQGALYGRNTFAGAINHITKKPGDRMEMGGLVEVGEDELYEVTGYVGGPVANGLGLRLDVSKSSTGGAFVNSTNGERLNKISAELMRLGMNWQVTENFKIFASANYSHDESTPSGLLVIPDDSPRRVGKPQASRGLPSVGRRVAGEINDYTETFSYDPNAGSERTSTRFIGIAEYDFGFATLVSRTGYEKRKVTTLVDLDQTPAGTAFTPATPNVFTQTASGDIEDRHELSEDLRLQSNGDNRLDWIVGLYYSQEENDQFDVRYASPALGAGGVTAPAPRNGLPSADTEDLYENKFRSVYGQVSFDFTDSLNLSLEGRYTSEEKKVTPLQNNYGSDRTAVAPLNPPMKATFEYFTPRIIGTWKPNRDINIYASAASGTKSGGFNPTATLASEMTYDPETNWTYELGAKFNLFDRRLQLAMAVYHIDWTDQQLLTFATGPVSGNDTSITTNISKSEVDGFEGSANWRVTDWLRLNANYAYTDAKYVDAVTSSFANFLDCAALPRVGCVNGRTNGDIGGNQLQFSPKHQGSVGAEVSWPLANDWEFYGRADLSFSSKKYVDAGNVGYIPGREELRLRAGFQNDTWRFMASCDNVTNDKTPVTAFESRDFNGIPHYYVRIRPPRQCSISVAAHF